MLTEIEVIESKHVGRKDFRIFMLFTTKIVRFWTKTIKKKISRKYKQKIY